MVERRGEDAPAASRRRSSLRLRILFLVCLVAVPLSVERMLALIADRRDQLAKVEEDVSDLARRAALAQLEGLTRARTVLDVVSRQAGQLMEDRRACNRFLTHLADEVPGIQGVFIIAPSGEVVCAHSPIAVGLSITGPSFQAALAGDRLVMTSLMQSRVNGRPAVYLLQSQRSPAGAPLAVAGVTLDLQWLTRVAAGSSAETGAVVEVLGEGGAVLLRNPALADVVGQRFPDHPLTRTVLASDQGVVTAAGYDGKERIYAYTRLEGLDAWVIAGMEAAKALAPIDQRIKATALAHAVALACFLLLAWLATERLVILPISRLARSIAAVGRGEADHVKENGVAEFVPLIRAFNDMARRLSQRNAELRSMNGRLASLARTDGLTGLANRRTFDVQFSQDWVRARGDNAPLTLVMLDVDHFKAFNDSQGHLSGDDALRSLARVLSAAAAGTSHLVARYGGEEFIVLLSGVGVEAGVAFAEDVRRLLSEMAIGHPVAPRRRLTASFGVASAVPTVESNPDALVAAADAALYEAKRSGRDKVAAHTGRLPGERPGNGH